MKKHLELLVQCPEIDPILALRSLFLWEGQYENDTGKGLKTVDCKVNSSRRNIFMDHRQKPCVWAMTLDDKILISVDQSIPMPHALEMLLCAMGMRVLNQVDGVSNMQPCDIDELYERIINIDSAWVLIRQIKCFESDPNRIMESSATILELALNWHSRLIAEYDGTLKDLALKRRDSELSEMASNCQKFGVTGLKSIELESDPRGAALTLMFDTHFEMKVAPLQFNWAVADISAPVTGDTPNRLKPMGF